MQVPNKKQLENCIAHIRRSQGVSAVGFTTSDLWRWAENTVVENRALMRGTWLAISCLCQMHQTVNHGLE